MPRSAVEQLTRRESMQELVALLQRCMCQTRLSSTPTMLCARCYYGLHFSAEKIEAQRNYVTCSRSHSRKVAELGFEPR